MAVIDGAVDGFEDDLDVEPGGGWGGRGAPLCGAIDRVVGLGEDAVVKELTLVGGEPLDGVVIDGDDEVALADAGVLALGIGGDVVGAKAGWGFHPPDAVSGDAVGGLRGDVEAGEHTGSERGRSQDDGENARLESVLHPLLKAAACTSWSKRDSAGTRTVIVEGFKTYAKSYTDVTPQRFAGFAPILVLCDVASA